MFRRVRFGLAAVSVTETGVRFAEGWAMHFLQAGRPVSPWHDIDPAADRSTNALNVVIEIPKLFRPKLEINTKLPHNPITQDVKKGKLRCFTYGDIPFFYGAVPRTYEDPAHVDGATGFKGDGDPLDVVLLNVPQFQDIDVGNIVKVSVKGVLAMIDENETDWKLICVPFESPNSPTRVLDDDVEVVRRWFRYYKTTDGKPENTFSFDGRLQDEGYAWNVIQDCQTSYQKLISGRLSNPKGLWLPIAK